jgi:hypothetical protein
MHILTVYTLGSVSIRGSPVLTPFTRFDALLHADKCMWYATPTKGGGLNFAPEGGATDKNAKCGLVYRTPNARADSATLRNRFEAATKNLLWSFADEFDQDADDSGPEVWGDCRRWNTDPSSKGGQYVGLCRVSVGPLKGLCNGSLTTAERCMAWFLIAVNVRIPQ